MATSVLVAMAGGGFESAVVLALQQQSREGLHIARRCVDVADLLATAATGQARAALVSGALPGLNADVVAGLRASDVEPVGVVEPDGDAEARRLHQMGISVVASAERPDALVDHVVDALTRSGPESVGLEPAYDDPDPEAGGEPGRVIAVWGPTGAPGRSTVAVNLAAELADQGASTLLVDGDVYGGAVAQMLAVLDESSGVLSAARAAGMGSLDPDSLARHSRQVAPMLRVLTGLPRADRWPELSPATMSGLLAAARALASFVVVDCGFSLELDEELSFDTAAPRRNGTTLQILEDAGTVLVVGTADPVGLSRVARGVVDVGAAVPGASRALVVNRMRSSVGWSQDEVVSTIHRFTGLSAAAVLPEDRAACDNSLVRGRSLLECAPKSRLRLAVRDLAGRLAVPDPADAGRASRAVPAAT